MTPDFPMQNLAESLSRLESDLGLHEGFCMKLQHEGDWSFVIQLHALIECAVAEQVTRVFQRKELADIFSRIELSNTRTGKLAFVKALNLLPTAHVQFIRNLSELRNELAHKVQNVNVCLIKYFQKKTENHKPKDLREFANKWAFAIRIPGEQYPEEPLSRFSVTVNFNESLPEGMTFDRACCLLNWPKSSIWFTALTVLDAISLCNHYGPQMWSFLMECDDRKDCEDWVHELFARAKVGDPDLPEQMARKFEHLIPGVRVARDSDGQPILESLAAAMNERRKQILKEL